MLASLAWLEFHFKSCCIQIYIYKLNISWIRLETSQSSFSNSRGDLDDKENNPEDANLISTKSIQNMAYEMER